MEVFMLSATKVNKKRVVLAVIAVLTIASSMAIVSAMCQPQQQSAERQAKEAAQTAKEKGEFRNFVDQENRELREALEKETNPELRAKITARLRDQERGYAIGQREAERMKESRSVALDAAKWAKISMTQAVQIATSQNSGSAIQCSLRGSSADKIVYEVLVIGSDEVVSHVIVSAIDGSILKTERELPRKQSRPE
jgi:uncharacterized membrane protein YkoI